MYNLQLNLLLAYPQICSDISTRFNEEFISEIQC